VEIEFYGTLVVGDSS